MNRIAAAVALLFALPQDDEKGFEKLFNGKDLAGFRFFFGEGKTEPGTTYRVENETLVCAGKPAGYAYTEKTYKNFVLRFDYRFKRPDGLEDEEKFRGNSGYLLFVKDHKVWPKSIEVQGYNLNVLSIIMINSKGKHTQDKEARLKARKPVGEWNAVEIAARDGQVKSSLNGTLISTITEHEFTEAGHIAFQSEGAEIHWRNIRIKAE